MLLGPKGPCPKCDGTKRRPVPDDYQRQYLAYTSGYDEATDTFRCDNCGGQYMYSQASGEVPLREDGTPCLHEYTITVAGRCLTKYVCKHCPDIYYIDSGD